VLSAHRAPTNRAPVTAGKKTPNTETHVSPDEYCGAQLFANVVVLRPVNVEVFSAVNTPTKKDTSERIMNNSKTCNMETMLWNTFRNW
jgi:hypothetical protein